MISKYKPRVGHPAKEGLRPNLAINMTSSEVNPRVGHPAKEGLRPQFLNVGHLW